MSPRRFDPERRDRIVHAALDVIAELGVAGASHRAIARAADVPLGSTTYHFASIDDLLAAAFTVHADRVADALEQRLAGAANARETVEALADHLEHELLTTDGALLLAVELYVAALRRPALRNVTEAWMRRSRAVLERHLDATTARELDAFVEGLVLHQALSTDPLDPQEFRTALRRFVP